MSYSINGKTYTEHPLLDEICYNCKRILKNIVIKNDVLALNSETPNSLTDAEVYKLMGSVDGYVSFELFPFTSDILYSFGYTKKEVNSYVKDRYAIPEADRNSVTDFANECFKKRFFDSNGVPIGEENDYYRSLYGLPPFNTSKEFYIAIDPTDIPNSYQSIINKNEDGNIYLHEQDHKIITLLYSNGYIDDLRDKYKGSKYSYILHLGDRSIDILTARKAAKWDILYMPNVYYMVEDRFVEIYRINREIYANRHYQEFFAETGEYYDQLMIMIVLSQTFSDLVTEVPEWYIRRDVFDIRSCQYFLESYGVEYFKEIPLKYQIRIVKNLNKLIKYKSSNVNTKDILKLFETENTSIYKYWLYKKRNTDENGKYIESDDVLEKYSLEFIASDIEESYDNYIKESKYRTPYDDITLADKYWDGINLHSDIKKEILNKDFTIEGTKYMSIEYHIPLEDYMFEMNYFLGLLLNSNINTDNILIPIPSLDETAYFRLSDLFLFLVILTNTFYRVELGDSTTEIRVPKSSIGSKPPINEEHYDWKKKYMPEIFVPKEGRILGFNSDVNLDSLYKTLEKRHSHYRFGAGDNIDERPKTNEEYKELADTGIKELGLYDYIIPEGDMYSIEEIVDIYDNNKEIYKNVKKAIANADTQDDRKVLEYVYQELFTKDFDKDEYILQSGEYATDLVDVLKDRDYILYKIYMNTAGENNSEARQDIVRSIMNDVISTLEYYFQGYGLKFLFNFTQTESFSSIIKYIYLMICFFKSYKVYFLDPYVTYVTTGETENIENSAKAIDNIAEWRIKYWKNDKAFAADRIAGFNRELYQRDSAYDMDTEKEVLDIYEYYDPDPLMDLDLDGLNAARGETEDCKDIDGGVAEDSKNAPYYTFNGGSSYLGIMNFSDINGGDASELYKEYFIIDGGTAYDPDSMKTDCMGSQKFNYNLDGRGAGARRFMSNTVDLQLVGTELIGNMIISPRMQDYIVIKEDGIFLDDGYFVEKALFDNLKESLNIIVQRVATEGALFDEEYSILSDEDFRKAKINKLVDNIVYNFEYVNSMMKDDKIISDMENTISGIVSSLKTDSYLAEMNPFAWEDL